jgi:hypothetical protein
MREEKSLPEEKSPGILIGMIFAEFFMRQSEKIACLKNKEK